MQDSSSKQQTKQKYKPNHQQAELPPHSALSSRGKTNKQTNSARFSSYTKLTQTTGSTLEGKKPKGKKNSTFFKERIQFFLKSGKGDLKHSNFKKIKRQRNTAQMREQTVNKEVQINEEEIGKLPEK